MHDKDELFCTLPKEYLPPNTACCAHPTGETLRFCGQFAWLEVGSVKVALSRPTHQPVRRAIRADAIALASS